MADTERHNHSLHQLFVRQEFDECISLADKVLDESRRKSEFALSVKAQIFRQKGKLQESLRLFQEATALNPNSVAHLKEVGRSLFLLSKPRPALEVWEEASRLSGDGGDWQLGHDRGLAYAQLKDTPKALECFDRANRIQPQDATYSQIAQLQADAGDLSAAINTYLVALEHSPESSELLTALGLTFLRLGDSQRAFDQLGASLLQNPRNCRAILAAGSIIQDHHDMDVALVKYRVAAAQDPSSPQLWNNIGMCFFGKQRYIAAASCLKRALCLAPCEWLIAYNLGLVHLTTGQHASAFHHLSCAINLRPDFAPSYAQLAVALTRLEDHDNACAAYERALALDGQDSATRLNYAVTLMNHQGDKEAARGQCSQARSLLQSQTGQHSVNADLLEQLRQLEQQLAMP